MYNIEDLLDAREKRVEFLEDLRVQYGKTVMVCRVNYPGLEKNNSITEEISNIINNVLKTFFKGSIDFNLRTVTAEGPISIYVLDQSAMEVKDMTMGIEDKHTLGRCVDIDVYDENGQQISRTMFGKPARHCFVCNKPAHECVRSQEHSIEEICKYIADRYNDYRSNIELV